MMQRRRYQQANKLSEQLDPTPQPQARDTPIPDTPIPDPPISDAEMDAAIDAAMQDYLANCRAQTAKVPANPDLPKTPPLQPQPPSAFSPVQRCATAIRYGAPAVASGQPRTASYKAELLQHSAIQRVPGAAGFQSQA